MWGNLIAAAGLIYLSCFGGMIAYAKYYDCDPLTTKVRTYKLVRCKI